MCLIYLIFHFNNNVLYELLFVVLFIHNCLLIIIKPYKITNCFINNYIVFNKFYKLYIDYICSISKEKKQNHKKLIFQSQVIYF